MRDVGAFSRGFCIWGLFPANHSKADASNPTQFLYAARTVAGPFPRDDPSQASAAAIWRLVRPVALDAVIMLDDVAAAVSSKAGRPAASHFNTSSWRPANCAPLTKSLDSAMILSRVLFLLLPSCPADVLSLRRIARTPAARPNVESQRAL